MPYTDFLYAEPTQMDAMEDVPEDRRLDPANPLSSVWNDDAEILQIDLMDDLPLFLSRTEEPPQTLKQEAWNQRCTQLSHGSTMTFIVLFLKSWCDVIGIVVDRLTYDDLRLIKTMNEHFVMPSTCLERLMVIHNVKTITSESKLHYEVFMNTKKSVSHHFFGDIKAAALWADSLNSVATEISSAKKNVELSQGGVKAAVGQVCRKYYDVSDKDIKVCIREDKIVVDMPRTIAGDGAGGDLFSHFESLKYDFCVDEKTKRLDLILTLAEFWLTHVDIDEGGTSVLVKGFVREVARESEGVLCWGIIRQIIYLPCKVIRREMTEETAPAPAALSSAAAHPAQAAPVEFGARKWAYLKVGNTNHGSYRIQMRVDANNINDCAAGSGTSIHGSNFPSLGVNILRQSPTPPPPPPPSSPPPLPSAEQPWKHEQHALALPSTTPLQQLPNQWPPRQPQPEQQQSNYNSPERKRKGKPTSKERHSNVKTEKRHKKRSAEMQAVNVTSDMFDKLFKVDLDVALSARQQTDVGIGYINTYLLNVYQLNDEEARKKISRAIKATADKYGFRITRLYGEEKYEAKVYTARKTNPAAVGYSMTFYFKGDKPGQVVADYMFSVKEANQRAQKEVSDEDCDSLAVTRLGFPPSNSTEAKVLQDVQRSPVRESSGMLSAQASSSSDVFSVVTRCPSQGPAHGLWIEQLLNMSRNVPLLQMNVQPDGSVAITGPINSAVTRLAANVYLERLQEHDRQLQIPPILGGSTRALSFNYQLPGNQFECLFWFSKARYDWIQQDPRLAWFKDRVGQAVQLHTHESTDRRLVLLAFAGRPSMATEAKVVERFLALFQLHITDERSMAGQDAAGWRGVPGQADTPFTALPTDFFLAVASNEGSWLVLLTVPESFVPTLKAIWQRHGSLDLFVDALGGTNPRDRDLARLKQPPQTLEEAGGMLCSITVCAFQQPQLQPGASWQQLAALALRLDKNHFQLPRGHGSLLRCTYRRGDEEIVSVTCSQLHEYKAARVQRLREKIGLLQERYKPEQCEKLLAEDKLHLHHKKLQALPEEIDVLTQLQVLDLTETELERLPEQIGALGELQHLYLERNKLRTLPRQLGWLTKLKMLSLGRNALTELPAEIKGLKALVKLDLGYNELEALPAALGSLTALTELNLRNNKLSTLPEELGNLGQLRELDLLGNQLTELPAGIEGLSKLTKLHVFGNRLTSLPPQIGKLAQLRVLGLAQNQLTSLPKEIGDLKALQSLNLNSNQLSSLPDTLGNLKSLRRLSLNNNKLASVPASLGNLVALLELDLSDNELSALPRQLMELKHLQLLRTDGNPALVSPARAVLAQCVKTQPVHWAPWVANPTPDSTTTEIKTKTSETGLEKAARSSTEGEKEEELAREFTKLQVSDTPKSSSEGGGEGDADKPASAQGGEGVQEALRVQQVKGEREAEGRQEGGGDYSESTSDLAPGRERLQDFDSSDMYQY
eukprot:g80933.t1